MSELQRLLSAYDAEKRQGNPCALATVVKVVGSAYRRPGARMLVTGDGRLTGTISGGCLEGDARKRAHQVMQRGKPEIIVYDSRDIDEDLEYGAQLGCQGLVYVLMEPINFTEENNPLALLAESACIRQPCVLATILKSSVPDTIRAGARSMAFADGSVKSGNIERGFIEQIIPDMRAVMHGGTAGVQEYIYKDQNIRIFTELLKVAPLLSIYGAGNDVQPLFKMAKNLGWQIEVTDGRVNLATRERFPQADAINIVHVASLPDALTRQVAFAVLMSHNYFYDLAALEHLSKLNNVKYIGILGPRKKTNRMLADLELRGIDTNNLRRIIHSPIGLDIGGENSDEIALSIMAELQAVKNGFKGGFLKNVNAPIHDRGLNNNDLKQSFEWQTT